MPSAFFLLEGESNKVMKGNLKERNVSELLDLISKEQKSGVLSISGKAEKAQIAFDNGMVVMAGSDLKRMDDLLGHRLIKGGLINQSKLDEALGIQKNTLQVLGKILIDKGYIDKEVLRKSLLLQVQEAVYRILDWAEGNYDFEDREVTYDKTLYTPLSTEYLLVEGQRVVSEWPKVRKAIPSTDIVFTVKSKSKDDDIVSVEEDQGLLPEQEQVLKLLNGSRNVQDIVDISRLGEFEATKALSELLGRGLIEPRAEEAKAAPEIKPRDIKGIAMSMVSFALIAVIIVFILSYFTLTSKKFLDKGGKQAISIEHSLKEPLGQIQLERIRIAVELYYLEHEAYPSYLSDLVSGGFISKRELTYPWGKEYYYKQMGGDYILLQPKR